MSSAGDESPLTSASSVDFDDMQDWIETQVVDVSTNKQVKFVYRHRKHIAKGTFGSVSRVLTLDRRTFALKELNYGKQKTTEVTVMKQLDHPNLIRIAYHYSKKLSGNRIRTYIFMEFLPQSLHELIEQNVKTRQGMIGEFSCAIILYQVLRGLAYMHRRCIAHRDVKPRNVLINPSRQIVKLCDFGAARSLVDKANRTTYVCSRWYRAPELLVGNGDYNCSVDMWSVGCVLGEMLLLRPLFQGCDTVDQLASIRDVIGAPTPDELKALKPQCYVREDQLPARRHVREVFDTKVVPQPIIELLQRLLEYDPDKRPHAWPALAEPMFDVLRNAETKAMYPHLFDFTAEELACKPDLNAKLTSAPCSHSVGSLSANEAAND